MKIELMCFSTARLLRNSSSAIAWLLLPCAISPSSSSSRRVSSLSGELSPAVRAAISASTTFASTTEPPAATSTDRGDQVLAVAQAVLEQIRAPVGAAVQQREAVARIGVLADHDHADLRMGLAQAVGEHDALGIAGRRHPDVGDHDVGQLGLDRLGELAAVLAGRDQLDPRIGVEQVLERLAHEVVVVGHDHAEYVSHAPNCICCRARWVKPIHVTRRE